MITIPKIELDITTKSPIWTGNINKKMDGVKESGISGSLRWWYEAILRGFGCKVCDPTSGEKCQFNAEEAEKDGLLERGFYKENKVCVCPRSEERRVGKECRSRCAQ